MDIIIPEELKDQWHFEKNKNIENANAKTKFWWIGPCQHEWQATIASRIKSKSGCPYCANQKVLVGFNDLCTTHPEIAAQWHEKNIEPANHFTAGSNKIAWWLGLCGHEWDTKIVSRKNGQTCPFCSGHRVLAGFNDLVTTHPELAAEWHSAKNSVASSETTAGSNKKYWWLGRCGHEWQAQPNSRKSGTGCPFCAGRSILSGFNDLVTTHPELAAQWHPEKNSILPSEVMRGSKSRHWWQAPCGHQWEMTVHARAISGQSCPVCVGKQIRVGFNDLATTHPEIAAEWHPTKNSIAATEITAGSNKKFWWFGICGHEWDMPVNNRTSGKQGCPFCVGKRIISGDNDFATLHPEAAAQWHPEKNGDFAPNQFSAFSMHRAWWLCEHQHEWQATIARRSSGGNCPVCAGKVIQKGFNDLATLAPSIAAQWDNSKNPCSAEEVSAGSHESYWWIGPCTHEWRASVASRVAKQHGCPFCSNKRVLSGFNDLATTHPEIAAEWDTEKNTLSAQEVLGGSNMIGHWICKKQHTWSVRVYNRTTQGGTQCPVCQSTRYISKGEQEIYDFVASLIGKEHLHASYKKLIGISEVDIFIPDLNIAIEYNGLYWHDEDHQENNYHYRKWLACQEQGIQLFYIWEDQWLHKPHIVKEFLAHKLGCSSKSRIYARKTHLLEISTEQARAFLSETHLQGFASGSVYLGLVSEDELVAISVFRERRDGKWELVRYATAEHVIGGLGKSIAYLQRKYHVESIVTFADHGQSNGQLYTSLGFAVDGQLSPDYSYRVGINREHKFNYRLSKFRSNPQLQYEEGKTEHELAKLNGLCRIYDAGKTRYLLDCSSKRPSV